jgi:hypothetical protein
MRVRESHELQLSFPLAGERGHSDRLALRWESHFVSQPRGTGSWRLLAVESLSIGRSLTRLRQSRAALPNRTQHGWSVERFLPRRHWPIARSRRSRRSKSSTSVIARYHVGLFGKIVASLVLAFQSPPRNGLQFNVIAPSIAASEC